MLALSRRREEAIVLDNGVRIEVIKVCGARVTLGVHAPREVRILREELVTEAPAPPAPKRIDQPQVTPSTGE